MAAGITHATSQIPICGGIALSPPSQESAMKKTLIFVGVVAAVVAVVMVRRGANNANDYECFFHGRFLSRRGEVDADVKDELACCMVIPVAID